MNILDRLKQDILKLLNLQHIDFKNVKLELNDDHILVNYQIVETVDGVETLKDRSGFIMDTDGELMFYQKPHTPISGKVMKRDLISSTVAALN